MVPIEHPLSGPLVVSTAQPDPPAAGPPATAVPSSLPPSRTFARLALAMLVASLAWLAVYLVVSVPNGWFPTAPVKAFAASGLALTRGTGQLADDDLRVTAADSTGVTLVSLVPDLKASDYPVIAWIAIGLPEQAVVRLLWRTDQSPEKLNAISVRVELGRPVPVMVANDPAWTGRVIGLALAIQAPLSEPIRIRGVIAKPMGALEIIGDRAREWSAFEGWTGTSINTVNGGADIQGLPLPVLMALTIALAGAAVLVIERLRPGAFGASAPMALGTLFLIAWLILDARWTANLVQQERHTAEQYAGKSTRDKLLANEDAPLFTFVERALQVLPSRPVRIFVAADVHYFRGRAAYHLYPHSVFFDPRNREIHWTDQMRPGDWLLVYQQRGIQYDASRQMLKWESGRTTGAELKLVGQGAALFRMR